MNADAADFSQYLDAAFLALAAPRPATGLAATFATFAARKGAVRANWAEALHPRGRNIPDIRGRINRGEFRHKEKVEVVGREREGRRAKGPTARPKSPLSGVSQAAYDRGKALAARAVSRAKARGARQLQRFADKAEDDLRALIANLKAAGLKPLGEDGLGEAHGFLYAQLVLQARLAREALAGAAGAGAPPAPGGEIRQPVERGPAPKVVRRLMAFTSPARRRRILHAFRNEAELARALGGLNLDDSEAADVVLIVGPTGEFVTDPRAVKSFLRVREDAVRRAAKMTPEEVQAAGLGAVLSAPLHLLECKTLLTSRRDQVTMSAYAVSRKRGWERRYGARFATVIFDDRRGKKFSGSRLYFRPGVGTTSLSNAAPVGDFSDLLGEIGKGA
jgi:hypothetical protein